nr:metallophosphoesterase [Opitutaceae bacterium]
MRYVLVLIALALPAMPALRAAGASGDGTLRFAIICDRTGGMRAGVFERAVEKINSLDPEFVMSVGDLIDGYTETPAVWTAQWDELDAIIKAFKAPFHAVVGNHDISNPKMRDAWMQRRGPAHYAFVRKNVLFLVLDSEDVSGGGFGPAQIAFARRAIAEHADVRWTFVFFHRPLWLDENENGFEQVADALRGRSYTVFTGHLHHYISARRRGMEHFVLATSGGDSQLRGEGVGEFDHVTTVTLRPGEHPEIMNHAVDGSRTMPPDVLAEEYEGRAGALRNGSWLDVAPVVIDSESFSRIEIPVRLRNPEPSPLKVTGTVAPQAGLHFEPDTFNATVLPGGISTVSVVAYAGGKDASRESNGTPFTAASQVRKDSGSPARLSVHALNEAAPFIRLVGSYEMQGGPVNIPAERPIQVDWRHSVPRSSGPVTFPGPLDTREWAPMLFTTVTQPMFIKESWDWHGARDGSFRFALQRHGGSLHLAVETMDDRLVTGANAGDLQDRIVVVLQISDVTTTLEAVVGKSSRNIFCQARENNAGMSA